MVSLVDVGVLRDTLLPNLVLHSSLAVPAYLFGRGLDRLVAKDVLWSTGQVTNVLYASIIRPSLVQGVPLDRVLQSITRPGWVLIAGVSLWGTRLAYRVISRTVASRSDDPRYTAVKQDPSGWSKAFFTTFIPEVVVQSLITLAVTIPFRTGIPVIGAPREYAGVIDALAIGLWSAGFGLEVLADWQLATYKQNGDQGLMRQGVWSIVRHPNYLGDQLLHFAYPLFLYANNLFNPLAILSPLTNWFFLRYIGGDKENEASQEQRYRADAPEKLAELEKFKQEKNSFWPSIMEVTNKWSWVVAGLGLGGVALERSVRRLL